MGSEGCRWNRRKVSAASGSWPSIRVMSAGYISIPLRCFRRRLTLEDVFQAANLVLWRKFDQFEPGTNFFAWACQIIRYEVLKYREKYARRQGCSIPTCSTISPSWRSNTLRASANLIGKTLADCMARLSACGSRTHPSAVLRGHHGPGDGHGDESFAHARFPNPSAASAGCFWIASITADRARATGNAVMTDTPDPLARLGPVVGPPARRHPTDDAVRQLSQLLRHDAEACRRDPALRAFPHGWLAWGRGLGVAGRTGAAWGSHRPPALPMTPVQKPGGRCPPWTPLPFTFSGRDPRLRVCGAVARRPRVCRAARRPSQISLASCRGGAAPASVRPACRPTSAPQAVAQVNAMVDCQFRGAARARAASCRRGPVRAVCVWPPHRPGGGTAGDSCTSIAAR